MTVAQMLRNHVTSGAPGSDQARADHHGHIGRRPTARHPQRGPGRRGPPAEHDRCPADNGSTCRYCLAEWAQSGPSATYTFLYQV
jgi:hypothetical protein